MVWHFVSNSRKVMIELIKVCVKAVQGISLQFHGYVGEVCCLVVLYIILWQESITPWCCLHFVVLITISTKGKVPASFVWRINGLGFCQDLVFFLALKHGTRSRPSSQNHQQHWNQPDVHNGMMVCNLFWWLDRFHNISPWEDLTMHVTDFLNIWKWSSPHPNNNDQKKKKSPCHRLLLIHARWLCYLV